MPLNEHQHSKQYYDKLAELLVMPQIKSVAYCDGSDYKTLRLCCNEKLRREPPPCLLDPRDQFRINSINNMFDFSGDWGTKIHFYDEGLGYGDLFIQQENEYGYPLKMLIENGTCKGSLYILAINDEGDMPGYEREVSEEWVLYQHI